jgi:hypothetical protein
LSLTPGFVGELASRLCEMWASRRVRQKENATALVAFWFVCSISIVAS